MDWEKDGKLSPGWILINVAKDGEEPRWARCVNPTPEQYEAAGWTRRYHVAPTPTESIDTTAFDEACAIFRSVCSSIETMTGIQGFRGGFDEMLSFRQSAAYSTIEGLQLAVAWSAANELCKYEGGKLGYGQPEWWRRCWAEPSAAPESEDVNALLDIGSLESVTKDLDASDSYPEE